MTRHSILFGIESYDKSPHLTKLKCPANDVTLMSQVLENPQFSGGDVRNLALIDVTLEDAKKQMASFLRDVEREDVLIFYFAGHGMRDLKGELYLCFSDTVDDDLAFTALGFGLLKTAFENKGLQRVLVILDCCYSGAATRDGGVIEPIKKMEKKLSDGKGFFVLSSAGEAETSKEGEENGVFTHHFVDGIISGKADLNGKGEITVEDMARYLQKTVPDDVPQQNPLLSADRSTGTFVVALNEERRRALEVVNQAQSRASVFEAVLGRLKKALLAEDVDLDFLNSVDGWIRSNPDAPPNLRAFKVLKNYGDEGIGLLKFSKLWEAAIKAEIKAEKKAEAAAQKGVTEGVKKEKEAKAKAVAIKKPKAASRKAAEIKTSVHAGAKNEKELKAKAEVTRKFDTKTLLRENKLTTSSHLLDTRPIKDESETLPLLHLHSVLRSLVYGVLFGLVSIGLTFLLGIGLIYISLLVGYGIPLVIVYCIALVVHFYANSFVGKALAETTKGRIQAVGGVIGTVVTALPLVLFTAIAILGGSLFESGTVLLSPTNTIALLVYVGLFVGPIRFCFEFFSTLEWIRYMLLTKVKR